MQRFIECSGGPIHVRETGTGAPRWLLVHGLGASAIGWTMLAPCLEGSTVSIDLPGFGLSPPWEGNPLVSMRRAMLDVIDQIGSPVMAIGNSMGGLVSAQVASQRPHLFAGLVLVAPATPPPPGERRSGVAAALLATRRTLENALRSPADRVDALLDLTMVDPGRVPVDVRDELVDGAALHLSHTWALPALIKAGAALYIELSRRAPFMRMVERIETPTLLVWGTEDVLVRPPAMRWLGSLRPDWDSVPLEATGHAPMLERPARMLEIIDGWKVAGRSRGKGVPQERRA